MLIRQFLPVLAGLLIMPLASACKQAPEELAGAHSEPAAAVRALVDHLQRDDLAGFARAAVPPEHYAALEQAWQEDRSRWPLTELPLNQQLVPMLAALTAPNAEQNLLSDFNRQFAHQERDVRTAARSLTLFGTQYLKKEGNYTAAQRHHYVQVIDALGEWAQRAPLADPALARNSLQRLSMAARASGLRSEADLRNAGMDGSLRQLAPLFVEIKASFIRYGLPLDVTLADVRTGLVQQDGNQATVRIHYPLGEREIDSQVMLERHDGRWYLSQYLRMAEHVQAGGSTSEEPVGPSTAPPDLPSPQ